MPERTAATMKPFPIPTPARRAKSQATLAAMKPRVAAGGAASAVGVPLASPWPAVRAPTTARDAPTAPTVPQEPPAQEASHGPPCAAPPLLY